MNSTVKMLQVNRQCLIKIRKATQSHELQLTNQNPVGIFLVDFDLFLSLEGRMLRGEEGTHHFKTDSGQNFRILEDRGRGLGFPLLFIIFRLKRLHDDISSPRHRISRQSVDQDAHLLRMPLQTHGETVPSCLLSITSTSKLTYYINHNRN